MALIEWGDGFMAGADVEAVSTDQPGSAPLEQVADEPRGRLGRLLEQAEAVAEQVAEMVRLQRRHDTLVDRLHDENQRLRAGELAQAQAPLIRDLLRLHDDIVKLDGGGTTATGRSDLGPILKSLLGILDRAGVEPFTPELGAPFDPASQQGVGRVPAEDPSADRTVARTVRCGFRQVGGRVLRPADVDVYQFS
jgi:molecular chaperone GrpE (heat shock protein)